MMRYCGTILVVVWVVGGCTSSDRMRPTRSDVMSSNTGPIVGGPSAARYFAVRLLPGADLRRSIEEFVRANGIRAGAVVTCVGSVSTAVLRMADRTDLTRLGGPREIVSLVGTVGTDGCHLHLSVSDERGVTVGGHLAEGTIVRTTAEIVLVDLNDLAFERAQDDRTGYRELRISPRGPK